MTRIKAQWEGEEREFEALPITKYEESTHHFANGVIMAHSQSWGFVTPLRLVGKRHTFGLFEYEETGEVRIANNEWVLLHVGEHGGLGMTVTYLRGESAGQHPILREVPHGLAE